MHVNARRSTLCQNLHLEMYHLHQASTRRPAIDTQFWISQRAKQVKEMLSQEHNSLESTLELDKHEAVMASRKANSLTSVVFEKYRNDATTALVRVLELKVRRCAVVAPAQLPEQRSTNCIPRPPKKASGQPIPSDRCSRRRLVRCLLGARSGLDCTCSFSFRAAPLASCAQSNVRCGRRPISGRRCPWPGRVWLHYNRSRKTSTPSTPRHTNPSRRQCI